MHDVSSIFSSWLTQQHDSDLIAVFRDDPQASLHTDGSLNLGICVLHSAEMLRGGFNWIFAGFIVDLVLEWKPAFLSYIQDQRLIGWINMVPNDVIYLVSSIQY